MTFSSFLLILRRQFTHKWGRFLLASGGIMIGIWAITLTTGVSLGLRDTILTAINSRADATSVFMSKTEGDKSAFSFVGGDPSQAPKLLPLTLNDLEIIKKEVNGIEAITPYTQAVGFISFEKNISCQELRTKDANNPSSIDKCKDIFLNSDIFASFYSNNKKDWVGKTSEPADNEIVTCFKCAEIELDKKLGVSKPEEMVGKKITIEFTNVPKLYPLEKSANLYETAPAQILDKSIAKEYIISAVVDDSNATANGFNFSSPYKFYLNFNNFNNLAKQNKMDFDVNKAGYLQHIIKIQSFDQLDQVLNKLQELKYDALSPVKSIIDGINTAFLVITIGLSLFGLIALIASIFGIINVMTISVLERKKEIGILKSLGAGNGDVFRLFLMESALIGFVGWLMGTLLAMLIGFLIGFIAQQVITSDESWRNNLATLNIENIAPSFPWWLLGGTLLIALVFTTLSGIIPALKAGRQNPVDVLRSE